MTKSLIGTDFYYNAANAPQKVGYVSPAEKRFIKKTNIENKQKKLNAFRLEAQSLLNNMCHAPHPQRDLEQFKKLLKKHHRYYYAHLKILNWLMAPSQKPPSPKDGISCLAPLPIQHKKSFCTI